MLAAFSVARNYYRLVVPSRTELGEDIAFFDCFRFFTVIFVVFAHVGVYYNAIQMKNPVFIETPTFNFFFSMVVNGPLLIHVYFVMAGFLHYIKMSSPAMINPSSSIFRCVRTFVEVVIYRALRWVLQIMKAFICLLTALF